VATTNDHFHAINDDGEETVTPATPPVPVRACRPPPHHLSPQTFLTLVKLVTNSSLSGGSQTFGPEPWIWAGWDGFVPDFDARSEKVFVDSVLDVGEEVFHGSRDDPRLLAISRLGRDTGSTPTLPLEN